MQKSSGAAEDKIVKSIRHDYCLDYSTRVYFVLIRHDYCFLKGQKKKGVSDLSNYTVKPIYG